MQFAALTGVYEELDKITSRLKMTDVVADFIKSIPDHLLSTVLLFLRGTPFPTYSDLELGIADKLMIKVLASISGVSEAEIGDYIRKLGDIGLVAQKILVQKPQTTLVSETLTLEKVRENFDKLVTLTGKGSQDRKLSYLTELFTNASPSDSKYLVRLTLGQLRLGVGDGIIRDAIAKAYGVDPSLVERSYNLSPDWGKVALTAKKEGEKGLRDSGINLGKPMKVMLAQKAESLRKALKDLGRVELEVKYDGARVQIHKDEDKVWLFTRRLEDVSKQFPEIVEAAKENIKANQAVVEGEIVAYERGTRRPLAFQNLSRRIKRKYDIEKIRGEIPVQVNLFDILYLDGVQRFELGFSQRRNLLSEHISESEDFRLARNLVTSDLGEAEVFYQQALSMGHEGVMVKVLSAPYQPGNRVGYMYKVKPVMESLDLVVTGATWGEGRRAKWLGSYLLSVYDSSLGQYLDIGRMATGLTDERLAELTELFKPLITLQEGTTVKIRPQVVFEVAYEQIQKSPTYSSGYALRFPRLVRVRDDKSIEDADTLDRVMSLIG